MSTGGRIDRCAAVLAAALLAAALLLALGAGLVSRAVTHFTFAEVEPAASLLPAGGTSIPQVHRDYDHDLALFQVLDRDRSGRLTLSELDAAQARYSSLEGAFFGARDAFSVRRDGVPPEQWRRALPPAADRDRDARLQWDEFVAATAFLRLNADDVQALDRDGDAALSPDEYQGSPRPRPHLLGTDLLGRDLLTRLVYGLRVSLAVGLCAAFVSLLLGSLLGLLAGYTGKLADRALLRGTEVLQSLPFVFVVVLVSIFARDVLQTGAKDAEAQALLQVVVLFCALGCVQWFSLARYARGLAVSLRNAQFVRALEGMGFSGGRIVLRHMLPNAAGPLLAYGMLLVPTLILEEAFLSFLGFGVQPPYPSLGILLQEGMGTMEPAPLSLVAPALVLCLVTWAVNVLGERRFAPFRRSA